MSPAIIIYSISPAIFPPSFIHDISFSKEFSRNLELPMCKSERKSIVQFEFFSSILGIPGCIISEAVTNLPFFCL